MPSPFSTEGLAAISARHPWRVIVTWLVVLVIASVYALTGLADVVSNETKLTNDYESDVGLEKLSSPETLSDTANANETIILRSLDGTTVGDHF